MIWIERVGKGGKGGDGLGCKRGEREEGVIWIGKEKEEGRDSIVQAAREREREMEEDVAC